jgi:DNA-directed RNA polymerase specialized sigma24 family protein
MFRPEKTTSADFRTDYATRADFCAALERDLRPLYLLAFLLTANHEKAEQCFAMTVEEAQKEQTVFKDWTRSWIKRSLVRNAVRLVSPMSGQSSERRDLWTLGQAEGNRGDEINTVTQFPALERFVFVLSMLERYSHWECSVLLACSTKKVAQCQTRALLRLSKTMVFPQVGVRGPDLVEIPA